MGGDDDINRNTKIYSVVYTDAHNFMCGCARGISSAVASGPADASRDFGWDFDDSLATGTAATNWAISSAATIPNIVPPTLWASAVSIPLAMSSSLIHSAGLARNHNTLTRLT